MLIFPPAHEDPLDAAALPLVDNTELNYRTRPLPPENELRMVLLVLRAYDARTHGLARLENSMGWGPEAEALRDRFAWFDRIQSHLATDKGRSLLESLRAKIPSKTPASK